MPRAAKIVTAAGGRVDPAALLGLNLASEETIDGRRTLHDIEAEHDHDDFDSFVVPVPEIADPAALAQRIADVADTTGVLRVKGFVAVKGKAMRLLVQAVGRRVSHHYDRAFAPDEGRAGHLVVIGLKGLDHAAIAQALTER